MSEFTNGRAYNINCDAVRSSLRPGMIVYTNGDGSKTGQYFRGRVLCVDHDSRAFYVEPITPGIVGSHCPQDCNIDCLSFRIKWNSPGMIQVVGSNYSDSNNAASQPESASVNGGAQPMGNSIVKFFRDLTLSADDKLLIKHGVENPTKVPTAAGLDLALNLVYQDKRAEIIKLVQAKEEEEKADKKTA